MHRINKTINLPDNLELAARENKLLAALPALEWEKWRTELEPIDLPFGMVLFESGRPQQYVYFPTTAIVSLLSVLENGASAEVAVVGNESFVGISLLMGGDKSPLRAIVQSAGKGYRVPAKLIKDTVNRGGVVPRLMLRNTLALITLTAQTAACNRHHTLDQQLCRWLLLRLDRQKGNELFVTHELIASMLGVRREGVTAAAHKLQGTGYIRYVRGHITVLDRHGLERQSCECYAVVKNESDRLLKYSLSAEESQMRRHLDAVPMPILATHTRRLADSQSAPLSENGSDTPHTNHVGKKVNRFPGPNGDHWNVSPNR